MARFVVGTPLISLPASVAFAQNPPRNDPQALSVVSQSITDGGRWGLKYIVGAACRVGVAVAFLLLAGAAFSQVPDPSTANEAPQPGSGHHYIGIGTEMVNPATGLVTFNLPIQTAAGRNLSFPFGIRYSSAEQFYLTFTLATNLTWWQRDSSPYEVNGWSYLIPTFTSSARIWKSWNKVISGQPEHSLAGEILVLTTVLDTSARNFPFRNVRTSMLELCVFVC